MTYVLFWIEAFVIWAMAIQAIRYSISRRRSPEDSIYLVHVVLLGLAALVQSQDVRPRLDMLTGIDGFGRWLAFSLVLGSMAALWIVVAYVTCRQGSRALRIRARVLSAVCAIAAMGVLLLGSGAKDDVGASFLTVYGGNPLIATCYAIFLGYIAAVLVGTLRVAWLYRKYARQRYMRVGMHLLVVGDLVGLVYVLYLGATVVTSYFSWPPPLGATTYAATY